MFHYDPPLRAKHIMTTHLDTISPDDILRDVKNKLFRSSFRHLPVVDAITEVQGTVKKTRRVLLGIISDRDILKHLSPLVGTPSEKNLDRFTLDLTIEKIMTRNPITVKPLTHVAKVAQAMVENKINCICITDSRNFLKGIITSSDFLKIIQEDETVLMPLSSIMTPKESLNVVHLDSTVGEVRNLIISSKIRHVPVIDDQGKVVGFIIDKDVFRILYEPSSLGITDDINNPILQIPVHKFMNRKPVSIFAKTRLSDAAKIFSEKKIDGCLLLNDNKEIEGLVTLTDFLKIFIGNTE